MGNYTPDKTEVEIAIMKLLKKGVDFDFVHKIGDINDAKNLGNKSFGRIDLLKRAGFHFKMLKVNNEL